jgi:hypothetical protein
VLRASLSGSRQLVRHLQKAIQLRLTSLPQFLCKARRDSDGGLGMTARDPAHRQKLVVFSKMPTGEGYVLKLLDHASAAYAGLVIEMAPPAKYSDYEDARISVTIKLDGFYEEWIEKGALLYYWSAGRYKTVRVSG